MGGGVHTQISVLCVWLLPPPPPPPPPLGWPSATLWKVGCPPMFVPWPQGESEFGFRRNWVYGAVGLSPGQGRNGAELTGPEG